MTSVFSNVSACDFAKGRDETESHFKNSSVWQITSVQGSSHLRHTQAPLQILSAGISLMAKLRLWKVK